MNQGKQFEEKFRECWRKSFPDTFLFRLNDQVLGYKSVSQNPCDFICFVNKKLFLIECKSHDGSSIPFSVMPQYERLLTYKDLEDVHPGFVIWFKEKDKVIWVPIKTAEKIYNSGKKSIGVKMLEDEQYEFIEIPSFKKRIFMDSDYTILGEL